MSALEGKTFYVTMSSGGNRHELRLTVDGSDDIIDRADCPGSGSRLSKKAFALGAKAVVHLYDLRKDEL